MAFTYILDTDTSLTNGTTVFSNFVTLLNHIETTHGVVWTTTGDITIICRASSGLPYQGVFTINKFVPNATNRLIITAEIVNGNPFILTDSGNTTLPIIDISDDYVFFNTTVEDSLIVRADVSLVTERNIVNFAKNTSGINGLTLDGGNSVYVGGIFSPISGCSVANTKILGCNRNFYGAVRGGLILNHCTIRNCNMIRSAGAVTNSIIVSTPLNTGDGLGVGTNYNIYDVAKASIVYASTASAGDTNSTYSVVVGDVFIVDPQGGLDYNSTTTVNYTDSTGTGNIGAFATVVAASNTPPVTSNTSVTINNNSTLSLSLLPYVVDNGTIDWSTLVLTQPTTGSVAQDVGVNSDINFDYSGTGYSGSDSITFRVSDTEGGVSNISTISITVLAAGVTPASGVISGGVVTRNTTATITMNNYTALAGVEVSIRDVPNNTFYPCTVLTNTDSTITFTVSPSAPVMSGAEVWIKPIISQ